MKNLLKILFICLIVNNLNAQSAGIPESFYLLLPTVSELGPWQPDGKLEYAKGDSLYLLIDGGADIYLEYGFVQALTQLYSTKLDESFQFEIYEMKDSDGAYGIYSFKTGEDGQLFGDDYEGCIQDYYVNVWKGRYLITLTALTVDEATIKSIAHFAKLTADKIPEPAAKPELIDFLPNDDTDKLLKTKYIRGNLALSDQYFFDSNNIFNVAEGVFGIYDEEKLFLFSYRDKSTAMASFENGIKDLEKSSQFNGFAEFDNYLLFQSKHGDKILAKSFNNMILIGIGTDQTKIARLLNHCKADMLNDQ